MRYVGQPVTNWYGLDLTTGDIVTVTKRWAAKMVPPMFEPIEDEPAPTESDPEGDDGPAPAPRRGRPRKA